MTWPINPTRYAAKAPGSTELFSDIIGRIGYHDGLFSGIQQASNCPIIPNGSFETDANLTASPTGWTTSTLPGGTGYVTTNESSHGSRCYVAIHPGGIGNGGKTLTITDALPVSIGQAFDLSFDTYATNATVRVKVDALWYDKDGAQVGATQNVFDQNGSYPGAWNTYTVQLFPYITPSHAKFMKLLFTLGAVGTDPGSSTQIFIDNIALSSRRLFGGNAIFTSSGTWVVPAGVKIAKFQLVGAGGDGTGFLHNINTNGGGAGYVESFVGVNPGESITITVGTFNPMADGNPSIVYNLIAGGGKRNGQGGSASGGNINLPGQDGLPAERPTAFYNATCGIGWFGGYGAGYSPSRRGADGIVIITY